MSNLSTTLMTGPRQEPDSANQPVQGVGHALRVALSKGSSRMGLCWVLLLVVCAIFAPLIANSRPYLMKVDGHWSSPMAQFMSPADWVLLLIPLLWCGLLLLKKVIGPQWWLSMNWRLGIVAYITIPVALILWLTYVPKIGPPQIYREMVVDGRIESALFAPLAFSPDDRAISDGDRRFQEPTADHWLGTTATGADLCSIMIHGARIALSIGFISTGIAMVIGVILGGLMGYYAGWVDLLGMRLMEIFTSIPSLLLLLCFVAVFEPNIYALMLIIGLTSWDGYATFTRAEFLSLRQRDFVQAAIASGLPTWRVLFRHMLPNGMAPILVSASFGVASAILSESTLSFLGLLSGDMASWGRMLEEARSEGGSFYWWLAIFPGLAIFLTVYAYNLIGESVREALNPKSI